MNEKLVNASGWLAIYAMFFMVTTFIAIGVLMIIEMYKMALS